MNLHFKCEDVFELGTMVFCLQETLWRYRKNYSGMAETMMVILGFAIRLGSRRVSDSKPDWHTQLVGSYISPPEQWYGNNLQCYSIISSLCAWQQWHMSIERSISSQIPLRSVIFNTALFFTYCWTWRVLPYSPWSWSCGVTTSILLKAPRICWACL